MELVLGSGGEAEGMGDGAVGGRGFEDLGDDSSLEGERNPQVRERFGQGREMAGQEWKANR